MCFFMKKSPGNSSDHKEQVERARKNREAQDLKEDPIARRERLAKSAAIAKFEKDDWNGTHPDVDRTAEHMAAHTANR